VKGLTPSSKQVWGKVVSFETRRLENFKENFIPLDCFTVWPGLNEIAKMALEFWKIVSFGTKLVPLRVLWKFLILGDCALKVIAPPELIALSLKEREIGVQDCSGFRS